jgi:hypothetical protein
MPFSFTDEIIDAIIQNEHRHVCGPRKLHPSPRTLQTTGNRARLKPDWAQLPPEDHPEAAAPGGTGQAAKPSSGPGPGARLNR